MDPIPIQPTPTPAPLSMGSRGPLEAAIALAVLVLLVIGCLLVLAPFASAILWAVLLCFSTWGVYQWLKGMLGDRKSLSALVMTLIIAAVAVGPFVLVGQSLADNVKDVVAVIRHAVEQGPQGPPEWVMRIPVAGPRIHDYLVNLSRDPEAQRAAMRGLVQPVRTFAVELGKALGRGILELSLSLLICFFLYRDGDTLATRFDNIVFRVGGARGRRLLEVASVTVGGVVQGILGTAVIQGALAGVGYWIAGVPGAFFLGFTTFLLAFIPGGPAIIWVPAAIWLFEESSSSWGIFMLIWGGLVVGAVDHFLKPVLISRGGNTPLILVMLGVFGGALAFGFIGVFIGPTLLAIGYGLVDEWSGTIIVKGEQA
jgi:predicted PurR-regulated permease PerM